MGGQWKFRVGKRTKPLLGVVVADVESDGGSLRRLHSRRRGGDDNGWGRQTAADGGDQRWRLASSFVSFVVCRCCHEGGRKLFFPAAARAPSSFVIHPLQKNAEPMMIEILAELANYQTTTYIRTTLHIKN